MKNILFFQCLNTLIIYLSKFDRLNPYIWSKATKRRFPLKGFILLKFISLFTH